MFIRPKDYVSVDDKLFFAVISEHQEDGRVLCWLRYVKDKNGMHKLETQQAAEVITNSHLELLFHSQYADIDLHGIPYDLIGKVYRPDQTVARLLELGSPDAIQQDAINIIKLLQESGIKQDFIGISGSLMLDSHNTKSDIDMIIYGRELFFKVRKLIKQFLKTGELKALDDLFWQDAYQRRKCTLSFDEYKSHELRKFNKCISGKTKVDISMIPGNFERVYENGPYKKKGRDIISSVVVEDTYAYDFPARYYIEHEKINEVVSYTATYTGQARKGEMIEASGYIEKGADGKKRLLVGSSREAAGEYIRVIE